MKYGSEPGLLSEEMPGLGCSEATGPWGYILLLKARPALLPGPHVLSPVRLQVEVKVQIEYISRLMLKGF